MLSSFRLPDRETFERLHAFLKRSGFVIYPGQGTLQNVIFRIAVMGDLEDNDIDELVDRLKQFFSSD
jgi:2-aminoethylphosphonate-pyruvate transaminase